MNSEAYENWNKRVLSLEEKAKLDSSSVELACSLWLSMKGPGVYDLRSGERLISIFREPCLHSDLAVGKLARRYKELLNDTGEAPSSKYIDTELLESIRRAETKLTGRDLDMVGWLIDSVE